MSRTTVIVAVSYTLFFAGLAMPATRLVDSETPYSHGEFWMGSLPGDTVVFSSGLAVTALRPPDILVSSPWTLHFVPGGWDSVVYRYHPDMSRYEQGNGIWWVGNPDTVWAAASTYPDTVSPPDSAWLESTAMGVAKWVVNLGSGAVAPYPDWNSVVYVKCNTGVHMKFQADSFVTSPRPPPLLGHSLDSLSILWAVDSLGNGIFTVSTHTAAWRLHAMRVSPPQGRAAVYDLNGRRMDISTGTRVPGVAVQLLPTGGTTICWYAHAPRDWRKGLR
jgi:hypothetical protein